MGRNCEKYLAKLEKHHQRGDYTKVEELWKKFGCLGRLHNLVRYIRLTPQRRKEFATIIIGGDLSQFDGLELIQNNSTRWNSWFYSITRALNVRERLELFCNGLGLAKTDLGESWVRPSLPHFLITHLYSCSSSIATQCNAVLLLSSHRYIFSARHVPGKGSVGIANFKLDGQHWFELKKIELALKDFYAATLLSEGKKTSLADWFSTLDCLLREISETKDHYHDIQTEDDNNFTWKQEWVLHGDEEKKRWFENAQLAVKHLWETEYKGRYPPGRRDPDPAFDRQREHKRIRIDAPVSTTDLYEQYISTDRLHNEEAGCNEAIAYWLSRYDSQRDLARFALDMFAISPMSDECESLFSSAKLTIVDRRGRLKADIIEACECLRAWYGKPQAGEQRYRGYMSEFEASDEEYDIIADLEAKQIEQEERVQRVRRSLGNNSRVALGSLHGDWTLYSSQYLAALVELPDSEIEYDWTAGEIKIEAAENYGEPVVNDTYVTITSIETEEDLGIYLLKPRFASTDSITETVANNGTDQTFHCEIMFLGLELLELRIPRRAVSSDFNADEIYYVAVLN
ncbi:Dimer-Tnp-hAT domain containing protein [Pyrenophora tritici-repentis]|nr:Dimer-Tnp-hAT domain containing protein [Pyrenophora tritici-repentis]